MQILEQSEGESCVDIAGKEQNAKVLDWSMIHPSEEQLRGHLGQSGEISKENSSR